LYVAICFYCILNTVEEKVSSRKVSCAFHKYVRKMRWDRTLNREYRINELVHWHFTIMNVCVG